MPMKIARKRYNCNFVRL